MLKLKGHDCVSRLRKRKTLNTHEGRTRVTNGAAGVEWTGSKEQMAGLDLNRGKKLRMDMNLH